MGDRLQFQSKPDMHVCGEGPCGQIGAVRTGEVRRMRRALGLLPSVLSLLTSFSYACVYVAEFSLLATTPLSISSDPHRNHIGF